jgi:hypothetical protein
LDHTPEDLEIRSVTVSLLQALADKKPASGLSRSPGIARRAPPQPKDGGLGLGLFGQVAPGWGGMPGAAKIDGIDHATPGLRTG